MASFTGKPMKDVYKDLLHTDNSNSGLSTTIKQIKCGDGDTTALYLSSRNAKIQPGADTTTNTVIYDASGNALITVDSTNDLVKLGIGQHTANTQYKSFGLFDFTPVGGYHYPMIQSSMIQSVSGDEYDSDVNATDWGGNDVNPASTLTISSASKEFIPGLWMLRSNITIDEIDYVIASSAASTVGLQLCTYSIVTGDGSTAGDLSSRAVIAQTGSADDDITPVTTGADRITTGTMTVSVGDVVSGKALALFAESSDTDKMSVQVNIKYHLR